MSEFTKKIFDGQQTTPDEWVAYLKEAHKEAPGMTPDSFDNFKNAEGMNSYQVLTNLLVLLPRKLNVLDLACGDANLSTYMDRLPNKELNILGVDMSVHELALAEKRTFKSRFRIKNEMAGKISEPDGSFDAILCHMAFMLMNPIEPVANEIYRLLKPGGIFAAVVGSIPNSIDPLSIFRKTFRAFVTEKFPKYAPPITGDSRVYNDEKIHEIFPTGQFEQVHLQRFMTSAEITLDQYWPTYKDYYFVSALPEKEKEELKNRLEAEAKKSLNKHGKITVESAQTMIFCKRSV